MDPRELQNLRQAYSNIYEATGREEMLASNIARAKGSPMVKPSSSLPRPSSPTTTTTPRPSGPVAQTPKPTGGLLGSLDKLARDTVGKAGEAYGRTQANKVPGANVPIIGDVIRNEGGRRGRNQGQQMYDKAKETVGSLLKQDYEPDAFDIILEYLVAEGYADTNENALVIMANMSGEWREGILEAVSGGSAPNVPSSVYKFVDELPSKIQGIFNKKTPTAKPVPKK